jgi:ADP-ribose pyrophosphatase
MIEDQPHELEIVQSQTILEGYVWDVRRERVRLDDMEFSRDFVVHPGAVGVIAVDDELNLLLVHQYRHPMGKLMWEPPAGLLDAPGEDPLVAAKRELREETGYSAGTWNVLLDFANTPGGSTEQIRCYLAQGLVLDPTGRGPTEHEEAHMSVQWVPLAQVLAGIREGAVTNSLLVAGTLALVTALAEPDMLRPPHAPWPARDFAVATHRVRLPR